MTKKSCSDQGLAVTSQSKSVLRDSRENHTILQARCTPNISQVETVSNHSWDSNQTYELHLKLIQSLDQSESRSEEVHSANFFSRHGMISIRRHHLSNSQRQTSLSWANSRWHTLIKLTLLRRSSELNKLRSVIWSRTLTEILLSLVWQLTQRCYPRKSSIDRRDVGLRVESFRLVARWTCHRIGLQSEVTWLLRTYQPLTKSKD